MGWKGTIRSVQATSRKIERDSNRRQKELERERKNIEKLNALEQANYEVNVYNNYVEVIQSIHKEWGNRIDWEGILNADEPAKPENLNEYENNFKAGLLTKLFGNEGKKRLEAIKKDTTEYEAAYEKWESDHFSWNKHKILAEKLLTDTGDPSSKIEVIETVNPFTDMSEIGLSIDLSVANNGVVEVELLTNGQGIVPPEVKSLLQSGKLSVKKMPKGVFNEIFQDHICSSVLRVGNELLAILPDDIVIIHANDKILNQTTGHMEEQCILSVAVSRDTISALNMDLIDPSDSLGNFVHNMSFTKIKGFSATEKLLPSSFSVKKAS